MSVDPVEVRKLLNDADMKIIDLQAADMRQAESSSIGLSALAVLLWSGLAGFMISRQQGWSDDGKWLFSVLLFAVGLWVWVGGVAFEKRIESAMSRAASARDRLIDRVVPSEGASSDLGDWQLPRKGLARLINNPMVVAPRYLQLIGLLEGAVGFVLVVHHWPS